MHTIQKEPAIDRTGWAKGPWDTEPDRISWKTRAQHPGMAIRNERTGGWTGYVGVPEWHPLYGHSTQGIGLAHHYITYAGPVPQGQQPARKKHWWIGFHCSHPGQYVPEMGRELATVPARHPTEDEIYWTIGMVIHKVEAIAADIAEMTRRETATLAG